MVLSSPLFSSCPGRGAPEAFAALTQSWVAVVSNMESLTPELLDSSSPNSENYSTEDDDMFWALVHQGYCAKFDEPDKAEDMQTLRLQWETVRSRVADFNEILTEIWPNEPAKHLNTLPKRDRHKLLKQVLVLFQDRTGEHFQHLEVWNVLTQHAKWERVLKPLILREKTAKAPVTASKVEEEIPNDETMSCGEQLAPVGRDLAVVVVEATPESSGDSEEKGKRPASISLTTQPWSSIKRITGAKRRKMMPTRVEQQIDSMDEEEEPSRKSPLETNCVNADYVEIEEMSRAIGNVTCVTPDRSVETTQATEHINKHDSGSDSEATSILSASNHENTGRSTYVETGASPEQTEEPTQSVAAAYLALAWANVSCSWADISPRLEESNDWFWFHVSSIYLDFVAKPDCHSDIKTVLKNCWHEIRTQIVVFHHLYEELKGDNTISRADRESTVSRAQEAYWEQCGHWFQYRAVWEFLERHSDWEDVLKPLLLGLDKRTTANDACSSESAGNIPHKLTDEEMSGGSEESEPPRVISDRDHLHSVNPKNWPPETWFETTEKKKNSTMSAEWLEWNKHLLEMQIMTRSEVGLSPEALEYLRLRRQQILQRTRMQMQLSK
ncbi:hypothetical protein PPTG_13782 [Phytophthora nicotianae INRA-310]|uniref:No apical meristem-associated C-terminal domain-containing protein n=1 Tax=Phytophthora nicotianae (strain INRA-310) TaxID=761204 RepID=W2PYB4_PHYN3|nr:hypothetical protein PPTG_13782 [Phytophthora nicotianae INRA-310]ETN05928.1 hypothetical protein PPTG_13782 [Phytophthora nicotianae INRA-310]